MAKKNRKKQGLPAGEAEELREEVCEEVREDEAPVLSLYEDERAEVEALRAEYERKLAVMNAAEALRQRGLDTGFAPYVAAAQEDVDTPLEERVSAFEMLLRQAVQRAVMERLRGKGAPHEPAKNRAYSREELRQLSAGEINAHWEEISAALRE